MSKPTQEVSRSLTMKKEEVHIMKIDSDRMLPAITPYKNESAGRNGEGGRNGETARIGGSDRVDISISREDIAKLENAASQPTDERSRKVASLKEQLSQGTYRVDAELVAKKMLDKLHGPSSHSGVETGE